MRNKISCGRYDCCHNNSGCCFAKCIAIGKDMKCQSFHLNKYDHDANNIHHTDMQKYETVFKPIPMAVFKGETKLGVIYPAGWKEGDNVYTRRSFVACSDTIPKTVLNGDIDVITRFEE